MLTLRLGTDEDRPVIYAMRHAVYATELGQHAENERGELSDNLDSFNVYIVAVCDAEIVGFVSITPPGHDQYSCDKYVSRDQLPFRLNSGTFEVRILTVASEFRSSPAGGLLMYAAMRWIESQGGTHIIAIGRHEVMSLYRKAGMQPVGRQIQSGAVTFELMTATLEEVLARVPRYRQVLVRVMSSTDWQLDCPFVPDSHCEHGGEFFADIGVEFDDLKRRRNVVNADVLDAWFPPAPNVLQTLSEHLDWIVRTSPPVHCEGMIAAISRVRSIPSASVVPAAGSSDLIHAAFRQWLTAESRVLILDPTYGEYPFLLKQHIGCRVDRMKLCKEDQYDLDLDAFADRLADEYDLIVLVNPNSPTGRHVPRSALVALLDNVPATSRMWIDETYVDYVSAQESLEGVAAQSDNVVVCKSTSKVYALSGVRAAYLCAPPSIAGQLRGVMRPWAVSLPGQLATVKALSSQDYYAGRYRETAELRTCLALQLREIGLDVVDGAANFLLCHLPEAGPRAATLVARCRQHGVFVRDLTSLSDEFGSRAIRIAVRRIEDNDRVVSVIANALGRARTPLL